MIRRPPRSTRTDTLFPYTTLFRSTTQNDQLSWGNGGDGPLQIVVGGNYVKQDPINAVDRAISRFPAPYATSCAAGGCSGFLPNGRYSIFGPGPGQRPDLPLNGPVIGRPARSEERIVGEECVSTCSSRGEPPVLTNKAITHKTIT